jgi:hypothetical protein
MTSTKTKKRKSFLQIAWDVLFTLFYPILIVFSLLFVGVVYLFSGISWLLSWLLPRREETEADRAVAPQWEPWITTGKIRIERIWAGEIMFGPAYYQLRTLPACEMIATPYFGDFHYECFGGVLLQRWNTVVPRELPDFDLLFFNGDTGQLHYIDTIKAFAWRVEDTLEGIRLAWQENEQQGEVRLTETQVFNTRILE